MADDAREPTSDKPVESTAQRPAALPSVESPSISPAGAPAATEAKAQMPPVAPEKTGSPFLLPQNRTRFALLAASFVAVAVFGGVLGAFAMSLAPSEPAARQERQAMQQSLAQLTQQIASLKSDLAASEKTARVQTARIADLDASLRAKLARDQEVVTGSIAAPASAPAAKPAEAAPLPPPRPQIEAAISPRTSIAEGWTVLGARRGFVYVRSGNEIYRVLPGDRLPGLGIVEDIRRDDLGWVVVTPRGLIVASRRAAF
jgi:cell division protein FtsB